MAAGYCGKLLLLQEDVTIALCFLHISAAGRTETASLRRCITAIRTPDSRTFEKKSTGHAKLVRVFAHRLTLGTLHFLCFPQFCDKIRYILLIAFRQTRASHSLFEGVDLRFSYSILDFIAVEIKLFHSLVVKFAR